MDILEELKTAQSIFIIQELHTKACESINQRIEEKKNFIIKIGETLRLHQELAIRVEGDLREAKKACDAKDAIRRKMPKRGPSISSRIYAIFLGLVSLGIIAGAIVLTWVWGGFDPRRTNVILIILTSVITLFLAGWVFSFGTKALEKSKKERDRFDAEYNELTNSVKETEESLATTKDQIVQLQALIPIKTQEEQEAIAALNIELAKHQEGHAAAARCFASFLSKSKIYKSYHHIVPICQFIQYLESGRCKTLDGANGCYNLYEQELRQNIIISELSKINVQLGQIRNQMSEAYEMLTFIGTVGLRLVDLQQEQIAETAAAKQLLGTTNDLLSIESSELSSLDTAASKLRDDVKSLQNKIQ